MENIIEVTARIDLRKISTAVLEIDLAKRKDRKYLFTEDEKEQTDIEDFSDYKLIDELESRGYEIDNELSDFDTDDLIEELQSRGEGINNFNFETQLECDTLDYLLQVMKKYSLQQIEQALPI